MSGASVAVFVLFVTVGIWLFSVLRRSRPRRGFEPTPVPAVARTIYCRADPKRVREGLESYEQLAEGWLEVVLRLVRCGAWTAIVLPERLHPWHAHNLTLWLSDWGEVLLISRGEREEHRYWLSTEERGPGDWLVGWSEDGECSVAVYVPEGIVVRDDTVGQAQASIAEALAARGLPVEPGRWGEDETTLTLRLPDPGPELNPTLETSATSRRDF